MNSPQTVMIAGSGAMGLACALALAERGARVTVFDPEPLGANASGVAAGMIAPVFEAALDNSAAQHFGLLMEARNRWAAFEARWGVSIDRSGAAAVGGAEFLARVEGAMLRLGPPVSVLTRRTLAALAPGLGSQFGEAVFTREDWRVDAMAALVHLKSAAQALGVEFRQERMTGREGADALVVATGAARDLAEFAPELGALSPIKGQILGMKGDPGPAIVLRGEGGYAVSADGALAIGATMEPGRADRAVDPLAVAPLVQFAGRLFPGLDTSALWARAGVRGATPDGLPLAGPSVRAGVFVAAGARRNGWLLAPLVADLIAACVTEGELGPYAARLDPRRFQDHRPGEAG